MTAIGGKSRRPDAPTQPQYVIQFAEGLNQFARVGVNVLGHAVLAWVGDPNAATKFDSKYQAKYRAREMEDIPATRVFHMIEKSA
jgi:hypothetical protein